MAQQQRRKRAPARRKQTKKAFSLPKGLFRPKAVDFKPDATEPSLLRMLHMTHQQRMDLLRWSLYAAVCVVLLVIQDVIMSRFSFLGATTDLVVSAILLITIMEGTDVGSLFVFIASMLYCFSGSSPGPASVALLTATGVAASMFRQAFWHWNTSSILLCGGIALLMFELGTFGIALFQGLTYWGRFGVFFMTAVLSWIAMLPIYSLINLIGQIGGHTWKE